MGRLGEIEIHDKFKSLYGTDKPIILITGGRAGLKSFNTALFASRLSFATGHVILYCRYTQSSLSDSVIPEFLKKPELDGTIDHFKINKYDVTNTFSKSQIKFRGVNTSSGNQTAKLKSIEGLSTFIMDEGEEWRSEEDFDTIRLSTRTTNAKNRTIIVMNPSDEDHFIYQKYIKDTHKIIQIDGVDVQISTHPRVHHIHTTYLDGLEYLSDDFKEDVKELKSKHFKEVSTDPLMRNKTKYALKIIGRWSDIREGVVFENWEIGDFNDNLSTTCNGLDFGFYPDPLAFVKVAVDKKKKRIYVKELAYKTRLSDDQVLGLFTNKKELTVCDTNEPRTRLKIKRAGFNIVPASKEKIADDIRDMEDYTIIVDPSSLNIQFEIKNYVWNDKKASIPIDNHNHAMDAMRYGFRRLIGKKKGVKRRN